MSYCPSTASSVSSTGAMSASVLLADKGTAEAAFLGDAELIALALAGEILPASILVGDAF